MRERAVLNFILFLILCGLALPIAAQQVTAEDLQSARERMIESGEFSTTLPEVEGQPQSNDGGMGMSSGALAWTIFKFLIYLLVAALAVFIILQIIAATMSRRRRRALAAGQSVNARLLQDVQVNIDLEAIEALAAAGRYSEAIHQLLLRTISELVRLAELTIKSAWTSREIADSIPLQAEVKTDLIGLVQSAELAHFADLDSSVVDYQEARSAFDRLVAGLSRGAS